MRALIRQAEHSDIDDVVRLIVAHARHERAQIKQQGLAARLARALNDQPPRLVIFVAIWGDALIGYGAVTKEFSTWAGRDYLHMDCLFVDTNMRGNRIGKKLFRAIENYAATTECDAIQWQTPNWNVDAQRFYDALGGVGQNKRRYYYRTSV